jgi:hypothetical protein
MADNLDVTPGTGKTVAADEIAGALHQRVKITVGADGTDDGDVASGNPLPVDVISALPEGANAIGKLAANSGVDIGDVDVISCALPTGASTAAKQGIAGTDLVGGAGAVAAGVQRVTLASDDPAVTDLAAMEVLLGTIDADTDAIKTAVEVIDNAIDGTEMQVDVVASLPAGTNNIGDVDVLSTSIDKSINGAGAPTIDSYTSDDVNAAADTANQSIVAAPGAGKQIWVYGLVLTADVAGSFSLQDEDDTALSGVMPIGATGGFVINPSGNFAMPWIKVATNKALEIDTVTCTADGIITYAIVSV